MRIPALTLACAISALSVTVEAASPSFDCAKASHEERIRELKDR